MQGPHGPAPAGLGHVAELLERGSDAVVGTDLAQCVTSWNHAAETLYGWRADEALGRPVAELVRPLLSPDEAARIRAEVLSSGWWSGEAVHRNRAGALLHVSTTTVVVRDASGEPTGSCSAYRDLTALRAAEQRLHEAESASDLARRVGRFTFDVATEQTVWSDEMFALFGLDPAQGCPAYQQRLELFFPQDRERLTRAMAEAVEHRTPYNLTLRVRRPDGQVRWLELHGYPLAAPGGRVNRLFGAATDVTRQRRLEAQLSLMADVSAVLLAPLDLEAAYGRVLDRLAAAFDMPVLALEFLDPAAGTMAFAAVRGIPAAAGGSLRVPLAETLSGSVATGGVPLAEPDLAARPEHRCATLRALGVRGFLCVPLRGREGVLGTLSLGDTAVRPDVSELLDPLSVVAHHLAQTVERRRAQTALGESEERYRLLFELEADALFLVAQDSGRILEANRAAEELYGWRRAELLALRVEDLSAEPAPAPPSPVRWHKRKDGARCPVEVTVRHLEWRGRRVDLVCVRDITERHRAEAELSRLSTAIEQSPEGIVVTDADATIRYVNAQFERMTGYGRAEAVGQNPRLLKSGAQDAAFYRAMWDALVAGKVWRGRLVNRRKDGSTYTEEATLAPVRDAAGGVLGYVAVKRDVTRELVDEGRRRQQQKLQALGRLAGGIAHDFNNVLQGMMGFAESVLEELPPDGDHAEGLREVVAGGRRAAELVGRILTFARTGEQGRRPIDPAPVVDEAARLLRGSLPPNVRLVVRAEPSGAKVLADPILLHQLLMNLATNAAQAMRGQGGGTLTVDVEPVTLDQAAVAAIANDPAGATFGRLRPGAHVRLTVADTGPGVPPALLEHLFEPYATARTVEGGAGLGLSVVHGVVAHHEGALTLLNVPGRGATFAAYFPCSVEGAGVVAGPRRTEPRPASEHVLVVDDEEQNLRAARRALGRLGYVVHTCARPLEALALVRSEPGRMAVAVLDLSMPEMDGLTLAAELHRIVPELPIVLCTGNPLDIEPGALGRSRVRHTLEKPVSFSHLAAVLRECLDRPTQT